MLIKITLLLKLDSHFGLRICEVCSQFSTVKCVQEHLRCFKFHRATVLDSPILIFTRNDLCKCSLHSEFHWKIECDIIWWTNTASVYITGGYLCFSFPYTPSSLIRHFVPHIEMTLSVVCAGILVVCPIKISNIDSTVQRIYKYSLCFFFIQRNSRDFIN